MGLHRVAAVEDFGGSKPIYSEVNGVRLAVYRLGDDYFAYANRCPHQGGPACEGIVAGKVGCVLDEKRKAKEVVSADELDVVCPWHGFEFDIKTGICRASPAYRLLRFEVQVQGNDVNVRV